MSPTTKERPSAADIAERAKHFARHPDDFAQQATKYMRNRSDRERALYVGFRQAVAPRTTLTRRRAARQQAVSLPFEIPAGTGFLTLAPGRIPAAAAVVGEAQERAAAADLDQIAAKKDFMRPIIDQHALTRDSSFLRFALAPEVLGAVTAYLGVAPLLANINVYSSQPGRNAKPTSSQLFHCDGDDTTQVKIFVLVSEVREENGPLMILDADLSETLRRRVDYQYRNRVKDKEAAAAIGNPPLKGVMGPPGTVCLVDTSRCFHYGSRVASEAAPRLVAMFQYLTPFSFMLPRDVSAKAPFKHLVEPGDSELVRLALGG